jgi:uroporphyrinogen III methyltransferase/synthase
MIKKTKGVVYFVGAGPGDIGLLTLRGKELLEQAEVVIYDGLANIELLGFAEKAKFVHVGKNMACRSLKGYSRAVTKQEQINQILVKHAQAGKKVVRLKGGDPFVFGRGGEEAKYLEAAKIPFEIIPGVSAGYGVPAYAGIPVTDREIASAVIFVTGHEDPEKKDAAVDWRKLATFEGTIVSFMGMRNLDRICDHLKEGGKKKTMPVAIIEWGTLPQQRTIVGTLENIVLKVKEAKIQPPALIVMGDVVRMRKRLRWFEKKPLAGKTVLVTRSQTQASSFKQKLQFYGAEVLEYPAIEIKDPKSWTPLDRAIRQIENYDWLVLTSVNGVNALWKRLEHLKKDARAFKNVRFAVVGDSTRQALAVKGINADLMPKNYHADSLFEMFDQKISLKGKRFLFVRADIASNEIVKKLKAKGAHVENVHAYRTVQNKAGIHFLSEWVKHKKIDYVTFTSSSTAQYFVSAMGEKNLKKLQTKYLSIGPVTSRSMRDLGLKPSAEAKEHTVEGLIKTLLKIVI